MAEPRIPRGWRLLKVGEIMLYGKDKMYAWDTKTWHIVHWPHGTRLQQHILDINGGYCIRDMKEPEPLNL